MLATSLLVGYISYRGLNLSVQNAALFGALEGIAEEQLFRGFFQTYFVDTLKSPTVAVILSSVVFMLFHEAVYGGSDSSLLYVLVGGFILGFVTWKSKSLVASCFAHVTNNVMAALGLVLVSNKIVATVILTSISKLVLHI
jgi:membrane protease YdiL (CAAX protease family)